MVSMQRKFSHLGIVSGIIGCRFHPVTCRRRHSRPQVLWPPGRWREWGGSLRFLVDARSLGGAGFARSWLCFTWVPQQALPPHGAQGTWHPLGRLLPAPAVGPQGSWQVSQESGCGSCKRPFHGIMAPDCHPCMEWRCADHR